jgi:hypothetical protein
MSRIVKIKYNPQPRPPVKVTRRRGSDTSDSNTSVDISDDEGYSAVDEISESDDDDEEHVFAAEEEHIISRASHRTHGAPLRPHQGNGEDADEEDDDDDDDSDEEEQAEGTVLPDAAAEAEDNASWEGLSDNEEGGAEFILDQQDVGQIERHVRFTGVPDSDSDDTTSETSDNVEDFFPDIFVEQSSLDPSFRREIEYDPDELSSDHGSFYDFDFYNSAEQLGADSDDEIVSPAVPDDPFNDSSTPTVTPAVSQVNTAVSTPVASPSRSPEVQELDGYETDGDTTEEDIPEPLIRRKTPRRYESLEVSDDSGTERPVRRGHGQPRVGRYNLDHAERKPIAVVNPHTRKMMIFTPQRLRRLDLAPESFNFDFFAAPEVPESSPILSNSASLMMGAMFSSNTFGDFMSNTQALGAPEAFFSLASDATTADSDISDVDDEDEEEKNLKLEDFITFHQTESDAEEEAEEGVDVWEGGLVEDTPASTPARPRTVSDASMMDVHPLLSHFDNNSDAVGAFRRNQINQQLILSDKASHESLAFSGPYHYGTLRGIKSGSMGAVTAPITPLRRHRKNTLSGATADVNRSPLETLSAKRKASTFLTGDNTHKRHRSISDMEVLQI